MAEVATRAMSQNAAETTRYLQSYLPERLKVPAVAIICGSGLGRIAESIHPEPKFEVDYEDIPYFPESSVHGHAGRLVFGLIGAKATPVVLMLGRAHFYEGHTLERLTFPVRVFKNLGVETIVLTNAAGGLNSDYRVGDVVILNDHLNLAGLVGFNPLRGPNADQFGDRFTALSDAYDLDLRKTAHKAWKKLDLVQKGRRLHEGVYAFVGGPTYETRAECRMLRAFGADVVGMSTVPEIIIARHSGLRVLAMSLVTNNGVLDPGPRGDDVEGDEASGRDLNKTLEQGKANHEEVIEAGREAAMDVQALVKQIIEDMSL